MTAQDLLERLTGAVSDEDWRRLAEGDPSLVVGSWNRATLLRMRGFQPKAFEIDVARADALEASLRSYLNRYMPDRPEGHRWIILSCLFLAFIAREPLHPREIVHHRAAFEDGAIVYRCPSREASPESLCRFCVCHSERERAVSP